MCTGGVCRVQQALPSQGKWDRGKSDLNRVGLDRAELGAEQGMLPFPLPAPLPTPSCRARRDFSVLEQLVLCNTSDLKVQTFLFWP